MYHIPGITNEANTLEEALGGKAPQVEVEFGIDEWRHAYEHLNSTAKDARDPDGHDRLPACEPRPDP